MKGLRVCRAHLNKRIVKFISKMHLYLRENRCLQTDVLFTVESVFYPFMKLASSSIGLFSLPKKVGQKEFRYGMPYAY